MRQTKQHLQHEIERLRVRLAAFGITEEMEPGRALVVSGGQTVTYKPAPNIASTAVAYDPAWFAATTTMPPLSTTVHLFPSLCDVCGKEATTFLTAGAGFPGGHYCQEHSPLSGLVYTNRVTTDGKPIC